MPFRVTRVRNVATMQEKKKYLVWLTQKLFDQGPGPIIILLLCSIICAGSW